jgi:hypothetical protein
MKHLQLYTYLYITCRQPSQLAAPPPPAGGGGGEVSNTHTQAGRQLCGVLLYTGHNTPTPVTDSDLKTGFVLIVPLVLGLPVAWIYSF